MPEKNRQGDGEKNAVKPAQIPLLEDIVFDSGLALKPPRKRPRRENYALDLDPNPPSVLDLFSGEPTPLASSGEHDIESPPAEAAPRAAPTARAPGRSPAADTESLMREEAARMVDNLVQEYSEEILRRLRDELTALLDDLQSDKSRDSPESDEHA